MISILKDKEGRKKIVSLKDEFKLNVEIGEDGLIDWKKSDRRALIHLFNDDYVKSSVTDNKYASDAKEKIG